MARDFAKLNRDVVFGKAKGKIIWQPRIGAWYHDRKFEGREFPPPFTGMTMPEIYRELDCSARIYDYRFAVEQVEHPGVRVYTKEINDTDYEEIIDTPVGKQVKVLRKTANIPAPIALKREVETEEELKVAIWREANCQWRWNQAKFDEIAGLWGNIGAPTMYMPRMNVQNLYLVKMGTEKGILALYDWPDTCEEYFRVLEQSHDRLMDLINKSPIEIINFGENLHAGVLPPYLFEKYHLEACQKRCAKLHAGGKFVSSHWDGDTKPLLKYAKQTGLDAIEAITPAPQGDVTLEEIKEALGDDMYFMDGIPAIFFDDTFPVSRLVECTHRCIELFAPKLVLGISDEISATGDLERVRIVGKIVDEYNAQFPD